MNKFFTTNDDFKKIIESTLGEIASMNQISTGWTNFVYKVRKGDKKYIFRFPRNTFFSNVLEKEVYFTQYIKGKISYKTADLKLMYDNSRPYTMHEEIYGRSMTEVYKELTDEDKKKIAKQVSNFIYELQHIDMSDFNYPLQTTSQFLKDLSHVDNEYYDFSKLNSLIDQEKENLTLSHADLNPGNILLDDDYNVSGILDFAFVSVTSDINDMARLIGRLPSDYFDIMLDTYNKTFDSNISEKQVKDIVNVWNYVEQHYMNYMRNNHPEIDF